MINKFYEKFKLIKVDIKRIVLKNFIFVLLGISNLTIKIVKFKTIVKFISNRKEDQFFKIETNNKSLIRFIQNEVLKISRYTPWRSMCFEQALTAHVVLRLKGISHTIYFGINKNDINNLKAHAWTRVDNIVVTGLQNLEKYTPVNFFTYVSKKGGSKVEKV